ncbi:MAG: AraC family transcriptional regulator ligand-binding domain-containing protein [Bacteroidota bacterium]
MIMQSRSLLKILLFAESLGADTSIICEDAGFELSELEGDTQIDAPYEKLEKLWRSAASHTQDPLLGLHMGEFYGLTGLEVIGSILQNSPTLGAGIDNANQYLNLVTHTFQISASAQSESVAMEFHINPDCRIYTPFAVWQTLDVGMVIVSKAMRSLSMGRMTPSRVFLQRTELEELNEYKRIFRCPIELGSAETKIELTPNLWDEPILVADQRLLALLIEHAQSQQYQLGQGPSLKRMVKESLLNHSESTPPDLDQTAAMLHMSPRSLQRKLKAEGTSFRSLLDEIRQERAIYYLRHEIPIKEVAFRLGFQEVSAFSHAFKRWTGKTPGEVLS